MASRSKKKAKNSDSAKPISPRLLEAQKTLQKLNTTFPYVVIAVTVLILVCLLLPVTGISATIDLAEIGAEGTQSLTSSVNTISILFAPISFGEDGWLNFLAIGLMGSDNNETINEVITQYVDSSFTTSQKVMLNRVMDLQHAVAIVFVVMWIAIVVVGAIGAAKKKSASLLAVLCSVFSVLSLAELITLMVISLQGMAGSSFVTGVGAYALPIVLIGATIVVIKWQKAYATATKTIREEEE
ncbi:MAG: hypothetical protein ACI4M5_02985 [Christensenellales bacterium]